MSRLAHRAPVALLRAAHPAQAVVVAASAAGAAAALARPPREVALVAATVLVGQALLGWHDDLVDRGRDLRHERPQKPLVRGWLDPGTVWFALVCGVLLVVPLSVAHGAAAAAAHLLALLCAAAGNAVLRTRWASWLPWAVHLALLVVFVALGGWDGEGRAPELSDARWTLLLALAGLLGVLAHLGRALPGLHREHQDGSRSLAVRLSRRLGARTLGTVAALGGAAGYPALLVLLASG